MADMTLDQAMQNPFIKSMLAPYLQPAAQLQQTQTSTALQGAETPGAQATSETDAIRAQQAGALQGLRSDLHNGMTLSDSMDKYKALGMNANDIFNQYLSENTWGPNKTPALPKESITQLHGMGVTDAVLGNMGDTGTFADKWNTGSAIEELRLAKKYFDQTQAADIAGNATGVNANSKAYENMRNIVGLHLSSLIPGASGAQGTGQELLNMLPSSKDIRSYTPGMIDAAFNSIENGLMTSKRYNYNDIGVQPLKESPIPPTQSSTTPPPKTGGNLLSNLLGDVQSANESFNPFDKLQAIFDPQKAAQQVQQQMGQPGAIASDYAKIATNPIGQFQQHPLNTAMEVLGPLLMAKSGIEPGSTTGEIGGVDAATQATNKAAEDIFSKAPGKLQQLFTPGKSKNIIGQIRDQVISNADKTGVIVNGDQIAQGFRTWADQAKLSNPSDAAAIEDAAINFEKSYAGKTFQPSQLKNVYDNIENGYTTKGAPRVATSAYIDRGVQDVLQKELENVAPGFQKTTQLFSKVYNTEKGTASKVIQGIPMAATKAGLNMAGLGILRDFLNL